MKQCQQCKATKTLDQFKLVSPRRVPMRFCLDCYTDNRRKSKSGEKPFDKRESALERSYGITMDDYNCMLEEQNGRCAICLGDDPKSPDRVNTGTSITATRRVKFVVYYATLATEG